MIEQRTNEWHEQRRGKFTSSTASKLMTGQDGLTELQQKTFNELVAKEKLTDKQKETLESLRVKSTEKKLGQTGETYAFEKAIEIVEGVDTEELNTYDINRGIEQEPYAFDKFNEVMALDFIKAEKCGFIELNSNVGSSPDGLVGKDAILEIKCPRRAKFYKIVAFGIDAVDNDYIIQMQHQMWVTGRNLCYFMNYLIEEGKEKWHIIEVKRDETIIEKLKERTEQAIKLRDEYVDKLKANKQY